MNRDFKSTFASRRQIFLMGGGVAFGALAIRLAELQLFRGQEYEMKAEENRIRLDPRPAHRGTVYDRAGRILAGNKRNFYVTIRPELAGSIEDVEKIVERLDQILPISDGRKRSILEDARTRARFLDILVADDLTWEDFARINVMAPELNGVSAEVGELRSYPYYSAFFHTVGYVQKANDRDVERMIASALEESRQKPDTPGGVARAREIRRLYRHPEMRVGKQGLEFFAESKMKGAPGKTRVVVNAKGRVIDRLPSDDIGGAPGTDIVMSVDADLQTYAIQRFGIESGSAVVMDIHSGDILVMASTPAPDPNEFVSGISSASYKGLLENIRNPLYHKAYEGVYPPGSTFKTVVAAAVLESGVMSPADTVHCSGRAWYYNRFYHCWKPEGHGRVNIHTAIQKSCDCYFYEAARRVGIEKIAEIAKRLGLGHRYELGITGGKAGVVPNNEWKLKNVKNAQGGPEKWYDGDTISAGIGQGYVSTTPVQLAVMTARIAGGKAAAHPRLVISGVDVPDPDYTPIGDLSEETLAIVRAGMFAVTSEPGGTAFAHGAVDPNGELPAPYTNCRMAGKSGTAQVRAYKASDRSASGKLLTNDDVAWNLRDHALFISYAPADKPRYVCAVVLEHGEHGSGVGAPICRDILFQTLKADPGSKRPFEPKQDVAANTAETKPT